MTVQNSTYRADYTGNGVTTSFAVPFYFLDATHLVILKTDLNGNATTLTLNSDYTVTGAGVPSGGTVLMTAALTSGYGLSILRQVPFTQLTHLVPNDPMPAATLEQTFDQLTMGAQQLKEQVGRAATLPANIPSPGSIPTPVSGSVLGWVGGAWAWLSGAAVSLAANLLDSTNVALGDALIAAKSVATGSVARTQHQKNADVVSIKEFGAVGDGVTSDVAAFNAAIAYANSRGGVDRALITGTTILLPDGRYVIGSALSAITKSGCTFRGMSEHGAALIMSQGVTTFTIGDGAGSVVGCEFADVKVEYLGTSGTPLVGTTIAFLMDGSAGLKLSNIWLQNVGTLLQAGVSSSRIGSGIIISNMTGSVNNGGRPLFDLRYGGGLQISNSGAFVWGVLAPLMGGVTASCSTNVLNVTVAPSFPITVGMNVHHPSITPGTTISSLGTGTGGTGTYNLSTTPGTIASTTMGLTGQMTTVAGTNVFGCSVGFWDTLQVTNCIFERFDTGLSIVAGSGMTYQDMNFTNTYFDYHRRFPVYMESQSGGVITTVKFAADCWFVSWDTDAIVITGAGYQANHLFAGSVPIAGGRSVAYTATNAKNIDFTGLNVGASCRKLNYAAAMDFAASSANFRVQNCRGNKSTTADLGFDMRPGFGLQLGVDADYYIVSGNDFGGATGGYNVNTNSGASTNRRMTNNLGANYSGYQALSMAATITNTTPFVWDLDFFGGTITGGYSKAGHGFPGGLQYVHMSLDPGEAMACGYSVAPSVTQFTKA